jgi:septum formation protein
VVPRALILASASPQRRAILEQLGVAFTVAPADVEELGEGDPQAVARENAVRKARAVAEGRDGSTDAVLGVDTLVAVDGDIFGKPAAADEATAMLMRLQGRAHEVWSGIALVAEGETCVETVRTIVRFAPADDAEVARYVATGEWQGRAGGYAIQGRGAWLVEGVEGDYLNVVGLPVAALRRLLGKASSST